MARQVRDELFDNHVEHTQEIESLILSNNLNPSDFQPGNQRLAEPAFDQFVRANILSNDTRIVQIWSKDGTILYSTSRGKIGKKPKHGENLETALSGRKSYGFETLSDQPESDRDFLEVYAPIIINKKVVGAYEAYVSTKPVYQSLQRLFFTIAFLLAVGLFLIWLTLNGLVRHASKTIAKQNTGLRELSEELSYSLDNLQENYLGTMESLASAVEARDPGTRSHSDRLKLLAMLLSKKLNLSSEQQTYVQYASALHDIGKIGIPEAILMKPGPLNPREWRIMKTHALIGAEIIEKIPFLKEMTPIVKHHHERFDGSGYPDGGR